MIEYDALDAEETTANGSSNSNGTAEAEEQVDIQQKAGPVLRGGGGMMRANGEQADGEKRSGQHELPGKEGAASHQSVQRQGQQPAQQAKGAAKLGMRLRPRHRSTLYSTRRTAPVSKPATTTKKPENRHRMHVDAVVVAVPLGVLKDVCCSAT